MPPTTAPAETETTGEIANQVEVADTGPTKKRLTITVPAEVVSQRIESSLGTLATQTALPGFRKGRAPRALLEKRFGEALRTETRNQLIADAFSKAVEHHKLKPIGEPEPDESMKELKLREGQPLTFVLHVEVVPEFELPNLDGIEIKKPVLVISDEHIEKETQRQYRQLGAATAITEDFEPGDQIVGSVSVLRNDETEPFFRSDNVGIVFPGPESEGRGQVLGLLIDGLDAMLANKKVGDSITIETTGPEAHEREDIRGAKLKLSYEIREARRIQPATAQEVIERFNLGTEANLREQIKLALEQRRDQEQAAAMREQLFDHLLKSVEFDLPERLSAAQVGRNLERQRIELAYRGQSDDEIETHLAEVRSETEAQTRNRLKLMFIVRRLIESFSLSVSEQEINGRIAAIALQSGRRPAELRAELASSGRLTEVASQIAEHKAADRVIAKAKISEISAEEWNTIVQDRFKHSQKKRPASPAPRRSAAVPTTTGPSKTPAQPKKSAPASKAKPTASNAPVRSTAKKPATKKSGTKKK